MLDKAVTILKKEGAHVVKVQVDLSSKEELQMAVEKLYSSEGETWDILVTTAGLFIGTPLIDSHLEDLDRLMQINALSVLEVSKLIAKGMIVG